LQIYCWMFEWKSENWSTFDNVIPCDKILFVLSNNTNVKYNQTFFCTTLTWNTLKTTRLTSKHLSDPFNARTQPVISASMPYTQILVYMQLVFFDYTLVQYCWSKLAYSSVRLFTQSIYSNVIFCWCYWVRVEQYYLATLVSVLMMLLIQRCVLVCQFMCCNSCGIFQKKEYRDFLLCRLLLIALTTLEKQDSWAIAKKTARCAQYMGALKRFESPHYAPDYFSRNL